MPHGKRMWFVERIHFAQNGICSKALVKLVLRIGIALALQSFGPPEILLNPPGCSTFVEFGAV